MFAPISILNSRHGCLDPVILTIKLLNFMYKRQSRDKYFDKRNLATQAYTATQFLVPNYQLTHFKTLQIVE